MLGFAGKRAGGDDLLVGYIPDSGHERFSTVQRVVTRPANRPLFANPSSGQEEEASQSDAVSGHAGAACMSVCVGSRERSEQLAHNEAEASVAVRSELLRARNE
jgi:hypothetical protein